MSIGRNEEELQYSSETCISKEMDERKQKPEHGKNFFAGNKKKMGFW